MIKSLEEQWCPCCHKKLILDVGTWKCSLCGYMITLADSKQGYGYPTKESTFRRQYCIGCLCDELCDDSWCIIDSEKWMEDCYDSIHWGNYSPQATPKDTDESCPFLK